MENNRKPCPDHPAPHGGREEQMLEIAFMDGIEMILRFPEHGKIISHPAQKIYKRSTLLRFFNMIIT